MNKYDKFMARNHALNIDFEEKRTLIQKIRSFIFRKFNVWDMWDLFPYGWRLTFYDKIRPIYNPSNKRLRKFIPRTWQDFSRLMVDLNFEMIKIFYEEEYKAEIVDWSADEPHKNFANWLESAYHYITVERPNLELALQNAYPEKSLRDMFEETEVDGKKMYKMKESEISYEVEYAEVNRIEALIDNTDSKIIKEFVDNRNFFWT
jgi:hypothetical protein